MVITGYLDQNGAPVDFSARPHGEPAPLLTMAQVHRANAKVCCWPLYIAEGFAGKPHRRSTHTALSLGMDFAQVVCASIEIAEAQRTAASLALADARIIEIAALHHALIYNCLAKTESI